MIFGLFHRKPHAKAANAIYSAIVAAARQPIFYAQWQVPDSRDGRLEMVLLHVFLFSHRFSTEPETERGIAQAVFDRFCEDMDDNLREEGVADTKVPKKMKAIGQAFYGRTKAYDMALSLADNEALREALARNVYGDNAANADNLALYVRSAADNLAAQPRAALQSGRVTWPNAGDMS